MTQRRRKLSARRNHLGYSQKDVGRLVGVSPHAVRSWEAGTRTPAACYRQDLAAALQVTLSGLDVLLGVADETEVEAHTVAQALSLYESIVQGAGALTVIETDAVPALLQHRSYANAITQFSQAPLTAEQVDERVDARMARQQVLTRRPNPLELDVIITDTVLLTPVGSPVVMRDQLDYMITVEAQPNVSLRVLPANGSHTLARGGFQLLTRAGDIRPSIVITFTAVRPAYDEVPEMVERFVSIWHYLAAATLDPDASIDHIRRARENYT